MFTKQFLDIPNNCSLESISLFLDDNSLLNGMALGHFFNTDLSKYRVQEISKENELLSPLSWEMPEIFRKKMVAYSDFYFNEVNEQNRLAGMVRYNFSNGMQVSAKEILRHPLHKVVPKDLLPQAKSQGPVFGRWPLTQQKEQVFISQNLREVEEIMQALLSHILTSLRQKRLNVYAQCKNSHQAIQIRDIEFEPAMELDWRVEFSEKETLHAEFKLICTHKKSFQFFETFALEPNEGTLLVYSWYQEWKRLEEILSQVSGETIHWSYKDGQMPIVETEGEVEAKTILKHLRTRPIPVKVTGQSRTLEPQNSQTVIQLNETGSFFIEHKARAMGFKDLVRKGWTPRSIMALTTLSLGLPFLLNADAKDVATKARRHREWDMKLLRHLGILQYLMLETLSFHFEGTLTDGRVVEKEHIFSLLHSKVHSLLLSGSSEILARETPLAELCSKAVLSQFNEFVIKTLNAVSASESFYSENGELVLEGVVEREFHLIYEILKKLALSTGGEIFRKSRTSLLSRIWSGDLEKDSLLESGLFFIPSINKDPQVHETLETLQTLIPYGFQIYYKGQPLQELKDDDFQVDFALESDGTRGDFNWFELNPRFFLRGQEIDPQNMGNFGSAGVIEYEGKLYLVPKKQMPSLRRLENFWMKLQKGKKEAGKRGSSEKIYHLPRHQILELLALRASGYGVRGDEEWKKLCEFYDQLGNENREFKLPKSVKAELKPYQITGVQWLQDLYNLKLGALLADDMGLGKTLQTLCFLEDLRIKKQLGQVLIVVPSSLIFNWKSEVEKFTSKIPLSVFSSRDLESLGKKLESKEDVVVITTYGLLMEHEAFLNQYHWKVLIFDEAQNLKNITTKRASSARSLKAQFKICLTGTPMENHYGEFYSLMDLLVPGSLGKIEDFRRQYVNTDMILREEIEDLKLKIRPLMMRRTKKEILDQLPEKQETKINIAFEERQKEIYRDIALSYNQRVQETLVSQGEASVQLQMLTALLRLRQACSDPAALPNVKYDKVPPKLEALLDSVTEIVESGESALVFTQFIQTLEHTAKILKHAKIPVFVLHGGIPTKQRQKILEDFNKFEGGAVLVMTLKTGGVGLNLTKASYVFHLEPWWNPSVENQATDRAHRLGQNRAVQVFRYIMHESLEEKIELLKNRKDKKFQSLFATPEKEADLGPGTGALTKEDFDFLLGIK
ncbi:MAG: DEAD/DEAH box helicase [Bdellovibrio sp.]